MSETPLLLSQWPDLQLPPDHLHTQPVLGQFAAQRFLAVTSGFHLSELTPSFHPCAPIHNHTHPGTPLSPPPRPPPHTHTFLSSNLADQPRPHEMSTHVFWAQVNSGETLLNKEFGCLPGCWKYPRDSETRVLSKHFIILLHT